MHLTKVRNEFGRPEFNYANEFERKYVHLRYEDLLAAGDEMELPPITLNRKPKVRKLNEVQVTASKIKFYHRGDTLVYNADAFVLNHGSMLDALLSQMPGLSLSPEGEIKVNGRRVETLLINGKDLFGGNNRLMLDNLGAYAVKEVQFYDKIGRRSELMGTHVVNDSQYAMNVILKKEYSVGWMANATAGYGTADRYLGKLFGMGFSDAISMTAYGAGNNLTDESIPGKDDGSWTRDRMLDGVKTRQYGGVNYQSNGIDDKWELKGMVRLMNDRTDNNQTSESRLFLANENVGRNSWQKQRNKTLSLLTFHELFLRLSERNIIKVSPSFSYNKNSMTLRYGEESFNLVAIGEEGEEALPINSRTSATERSGHGLSASLGVISDNKLRSGRYPLLLSAKVSAWFKTSPEDMMQEQTVTYARGDLPDEHLLQRTDKSPDRSIGADAAVTLTQFIPRYRLSFPLAYEISYQDLVNNRRLRQLTADRWEPVGALSPQLSGKLLTQTISLRIQQSKSKIERSVSTYFSAGVDVKNYNRRYDYEVNGRLQTPRRNNWHVNAEASATLRWHAARSAFSNYHELELSASSKADPADIYHIIALPSTDPLTEYRENPDLKDSRRSNLSLRANFPFGPSSHYAWLSFTTLRNQSCYVVDYDMTSGRSVISRRNVSGDWLAGALYNFNTSFTRKSPFHLRAGASYNMTEVQNLTSTRGEAPRASRIKWTNTGASLNLSWSKGSTLRLSVSGESRYNHSANSSDSAGESPAPFWYHRAGVAARINLPKGWSASTDLMLHMRRGLALDGGNANEWVWNARVSKSFLKGSLVVSADGYDLLRQLAEVTVIINEQSRTETRSETVPSFILLHVFYKFNSAPRKR